MSDSSGGTLELPESLCAFAYMCRECKETTILHLPFSDVARWRGGELIQNVFPQLSDAIRELMISGTCGKCFEGLFEEDVDV